MKIPYNYVLVKPDENFTEYMGTGIKTANDAESYGQRLSVRGRIVKLPSSLHYNGYRMLEERKKFANDHSSLSIMRELRDSSCLYDVRVEPKEGDTVFFNYMEHLECYQNGRWIETEEGDMLLMRYDNLVCSHKLNNPSSLTTLNGLVLIEPLHQEVDEEIETVVMQNYKHKIQKRGLGRVILTGARCKSYLEDLDAPVDSNEVMEGDIILFKPLGAMNIEWGLHQVLFKGRKVQAIHRRNILMIN